MGFATAEPYIWSHLVRTWDKPLKYQLIAEIARWAAERADALYLSVMPDNEAAIALYARNGFVDTGEPGDLLADGVRREIVMAKAL